MSSDMEDAADLINDISKRVNRLEQTDESGRPNPLRLVDEEVVIEDDPMTMTVGTMDTAVYDQTSYDGAAGPGAANAGKVYDA